MKRRMPSGNRQGNGPLMTDHLRDLELELQLLKRKRSMIEQQQRMLSDNRQQPYQQDFDMGYQRNFANLYEDDHHRGQPAGSQFGQNYHSDAIWDHPAPQPQPQPIYSAPQPAHFEFSDNRNNDRFANKKKPRRPNPWANPVPLLNTPISAPHFSQSGSKLSAKISRIRTREPPKRRTDFKPDKVAKPKTTHSPVDTLKQQNLQIRKDLIKKASPLVTSRKGSSERYLPDVTPSNQVVGRMEFCLGTVLKDIRSKYGSSHAKVVNDPNHLRTIKEVIRERIQAVMLGKVVSGNNVVIEQYREKYPISTDKEIVDLCSNVDIVQKHKKRVKLFLPEDDPEKFFKINFHKLFVKQLDDMFAKISLLHKQQNKKDIEEIIKDLPDLTEDGKGFQTVVLDQDKNSVVTNAEITNGAPNNTADQQETTTSAQATEQGTAAAVNETSANKELKESSDITETVETSITEKDTTQEPTVEALSTENAIKIGDENEKPKKKMDNTQKTKFYIDLLDQLIEQRLPQYLKNKREEILEIMNIDLQFKATRAAVILETNKIAEKLAKVPVIHEKSHNPNPKAETKKSAVKMQTEKPEPPQNNQKKLLYVKILAKPNLPETAIMKAFLDGFHPKLIKKPRTVQNLLIIGLSQQEDYDNLLAANGTTVGNKRLLVTKSDKIKAKKNDETIQEENTATTNNDKPIIPDDLENQITDLLSSIRKAEESDSKESSAANVKLEKITADTEAIPEPIIEKTSSTAEPITENAEDAINVATKADEKVSEPTTLEASEPEEIKPMGNVSETGQTKPVETVSESGQTRPMETATETGQTNPVVTATETGQTKPMETTSETEIAKSSDENGAMDVEVAKPVQIENIQKQDTAVPSTPTRSSARITRSKLANQ